MKLKKEFIVHNTGREAMLVPTASADFYGVVKGNEVLGDILSLLGREISEEELVQAMAAQYDAPVDALARDVRKALSELRKIGALEE